MRTYLFLLTSVLIVSACNDEQEADAEIVGIWQLTEILADPGDGSGTFQPTTVDKIVTFFDNGTVTTTQSFCAYGEDEVPGNTARYSEADLMILPDCPSVPELALPYSIDGDELVINYLCIEPCAEKYRKVAVLD